MGNWSEWRKKGQQALLSDCVNQQMERILLIDFSFSLHPERSLKSMHPCCWPLGLVFHWCSGKLVLIDAAADHVNQLLSSKYLFCFCPLRIISGNKLNDTRIFHMDSNKWTTKTFDSRFQRLTNWNYFFHKKRKAGNQLIQQLHGSHNAISFHVNHGPKIRIALNWKTFACLSWIITLGKTCD